MNKRFTVEESNLISIFMEEGIDSDVGGRKKVINGIDKALKYLEDELVHFFMEWLISVQDIPSSIKITTKRSYV